MAEQVPAAAKKMPWPKFCAEPEQVMNWLNKQRPADTIGKKAVLTLRWLMNLELEELKPGPISTGISDFIPDEPQTLTSRHGH